MNTLGQWKTMTSHESIMWSKYSTFKRKREGWSYQTYLDNVYSGKLDKDFYLFWDWYDKKSKDTGFSASYKPGSEAWV